MFRLWVTIVILQFLLSAAVVFAKDIKSYSEIPEDANPNYEVLEHYLKKYISYSDIKNRPYKFTITPNNPKELILDLTTDEYVIKQLNKTSMISYLMYEDGEIVIDEITPKDRFGHLFTNETLWVSNSAGKSIMSYVYGHAVCRGHVDGIHQTMNWDILENTLYEGQPIINILNMAPGDKKVKIKRNINMSSLESLLKTEYKNVKATKSKYNYNNVNTNLIASYPLYKMGLNEYEKMLNEIFADKIGIEHNVVFYKPREAGEDEASVTYGMHISRYDYLRIAIAMLNDWNNNTCEGQYLKSLYENKIKKNEDYRNKNEAFSKPKYYAGQFHTFKNKKIFVLDGYGGQTISIDFDNNTIISTLAIHRDFNWMKLVHSKF